MIQKSETSLPRFLIAKYVSDLRRMEPRNVGVIVWADGEVTGKFLGDGEHGPIPDNVQSKNAYRQWLEYWNLQISKDRLSRRDGSTVERSEAEYVDVLQERSKPQYMLVDGGILMESISTPAELGEVADELFSELVATPGRSEHKSGETDERRHLYHASRKAMKSSGISDRQDFWNGFDWSCRVGETTQPFHFDYALHASEPTAVFHRVPLTQPDKTHGTAFRFECMQKTGLHRNQCASLVYVTESDLNDDDVRQSWEMMESFGVVINTVDLDRAAGELLKLAG
jgi:hypothetical protein